MPIKPYLTDVSDEQWSFAAPYLVLMTQDAPQREHSLREVFNALRWIVRAGSPWRLLPNDFAPCEAVYQQSRRWLGGQLLRGPNLNATETGRLGSQRNMTNSDDLLQPHPRYAIDANRMYDLRSTARIVELLAVRNEDRSDGWTQALMEAAWNGSIEIPHTPFFEGPDGFTYLRLDVPRPGLPFESNCLARQAKMLLSTVRGAALFSGPEATEPAYIFPVGMIDAMVRFDSHQGDPIDLAEIMAAPHMSFGGEIRPSSESLVGSPSRDFLPPHTAKGFHWHLVNGWGIAAPRVALIVLKNAAPSRNLVIDRTIDEIPGNARHAEAVVRMLLWYLPPRRSILLRPPSLAIGDMTLLSDYFE